VRVLLASYPEALEGEEFRVFTPHPAKEKVERRLRTLEFIAQVLELLDPLCDGLCLCPVLEADSHLVSLVADVALPGQVRHQHAPVIADLARIDVFVRRGILHYGRNMNAAL